MDGSVNCRNKIAFQISTALCGREAKQGLCQMISWRRRVEKEMKQFGKAWSGIQVMAKDRHVWKKYGRNGQE